MSEPDTAPPADAGAMTPGRARLFAREPVLTANLLAALVLEGCVLLRAFGLPLTDAQQNAINGVAGVLVTIGAAIIARRFTTPVALPRNNFDEPLIAQTHPHGVTPPNGGSPATG